MGIQTKLACVSCWPRLLPSPADTLSLDDASFPNKSSNMDRGGVSIKIYRKRCRFKTTLYTVMVVAGGLYSKFLNSVLEIRPAVSFRGFTARILCILLSSILLNNTEEHFKNRGKKIHKLYFRYMDDETKYFKLLF
jgi:hypothetical protein